MAKIIPFERNSRKNKENKKDSEYLADLICTGEVTKESMDALEELERAKRNARMRAYPDFLQE